ncbi:hypothetical protein I79_008112 [Cricetulus griseus]|uniref:Uncharacterized protein n=1 Tax=Cricetulus griseus TaxID=10029 RepID=G3HCA6_CRIGR|nr:hypothetical protein I79_008112 [Cricetulus griseus]
MVSHLWHGEIWRFVAVPQDKFKRIFKDFSTKVTIVNDSIEQVSLKEARDRIP